MKPKPPGSRSTPVVSFRLGREAYALLDREAKAGASSPSRMAKQYVLVCLGIA